MRSQTELIAILMAILLSGRRYGQSAESSNNLAMLNEEKRIAVREARDILQMAASVPNLSVADDIFRE